MFPAIITLHLESHNLCYLHELNDFQAINFHESFYVPNDDFSICYINLCHIPHYVFDLAIYCIDEMRFPSQTTDFAYYETKFIIVPAAFMSILGK